MMHTGIPEGFEEEVARAVLLRQKGDLHFLAAETEGFEWRPQALRLIEDAEKKLEDISPEPVSRVVLFTGHRLDDPGREHARFPRHKVRLAREAIDAAVARAGRGDGVAGISGGASGGDLLFLETCERMNVARNMFLIIPRNDYIKASVESGGREWVNSFDHHYESARVRIYQDSAELPAWLRAKPNYSVWQRSNLWMLHNALAYGPEKVRVIALWNGQGGDGPGGTEHMVQSARANGAEVDLIDTNRLFGLD